MRVSLPLADIRGTLTLRKDRQLAPSMTLRTDSLDTLASFATLHRLFVSTALIHFLSPPTTLGIKIGLFAFLGDTWRSFPAVSRRFTFKASDRLTPRSSAVILVDFPVSMRAETAILFSDQY